MEDAHLDLLYQSFLNRIVSIMLHNPTFRPDVEALLEKHIHSADFDGMYMEISPARLVYGNILCLGGTIETETLLHNFLRHFAATVETDPELAEILAEFRMRSVNNFLLPNITFCFSLYATEEERVVPSRARKMQTLSQDHDVENFRRAMKSMGFPEPNPGNTESS